MVGITLFTGLTAKWHIAVSGYKVPATSHALLIYIMGHSLPPYTIIID
jgi:hypothetical protein